jgi:hypothetical protein
MYIHGKRKRFSKRIPTCGGGALPGELKISPGEAAFRGKMRSKFDKVGQSLLLVCCASGFRGLKAAEGRIVYQHPVSVPWRSLFAFRGAYSGSKSALESQILHIMRT